MPKIIASPSAAPTEPPIKPKSIAPTVTSILFILPLAIRTAVFCPVFFLASFNLSL